MTSESLLSFFNTQSHNQAFVNYSLNEETRLDVGNQFKAADFSLSEYNPFLEYIGTAINQKLEKKNLVISNLNLKNLNGSKTAGIAGYKANAILFNNGNYAAAAHEMGHMNDLAHTFCCHE